MNDNEFKKTFEKKESYEPAIEIELSGKGLNKNLSSWVELVNPLKDYMQNCGFNDDNVAIVFKCKCGKAIAYHIEEIPKLTTKCECGKYLIKYTKRLK